MGNSLGARIIARGLAGAKVDKADFRLKFFIDQEQ
jgi:hypothetical protein